MQVLTPSGYRDVATLTEGDEVCAFDAETGAPIVNYVEVLQPVDYAEWCRWWQVEDTVPAFKWYRVNDAFLLFSEQSIWRNGTNICHAKHLVVGDEIYDDADQPVPIATIETVTDESLIWYRFDVSGDHSYIIDGLTVHNASRFWVGGTGTWDSSTTTHWAASSNGAGGQSVPGSADTVTLDANSGGGTVTLNYGGTITIQSFTCGTFTGTFDNSVNNNNMTLSSATGFSGTGTGARTLKLGTATYSLTSGTAQWTFTTTTNLTLTGSSFNVAFSGSSTGALIINMGVGLSQGNFTLGPCSGVGRYSISHTSTIASLSITAPAVLEFGISSTFTISSLFNLVGSNSAPIFIKSSSTGISSTIAAAASSVAQWCAFRDMTFTGSPVASNSFDLGGNIGITITPPGTGGVGVIGS